MFGPWMTSKMVAKQFVYGMLFLAVAGWVLWTYQDQIRGLVRGLPGPTVIVDEDTGVRVEVYPRPLDGVLVQELATSTVAAVMFDNAPEAWPHKGLTDAQMVWEMPVEGARTRLMALYDLGYINEDVTIGPVRSVRPYFLSVAKSYDARIMHVGGSPEALDMISEGFIPSLNEFNRGQYYWRDRSRYAPHNAMTSGELILEAAESYEFAEAAFTPLLYDDVETESRVSPSYVFGELDISWTYDFETGLYVRRQSGRPFRDDDDVVAAANVVIVFAPMSVIDNKLRRSVVTVGEGDAVVYRAGEKVDATWSRSSSNETTRFLDEGGEEISFARGTTWVSVLPTGWSITSTVSK